MNLQLAREIAQKLREPLVWLVCRVVDVIGAERARECCQQALEIEANGGLMTSNGQRRRTPGGVFFSVVRNQVSAEERQAIFARTKKKKASGQAPPQGESQVAPPTWDECQAYIRQLLARPKGEVSQMKFTLSGRPKQVGKAKTCMVCVMAGKPVPQDMPKGLPTPPSTPMNFAVFMADKHWQQVADSLREHKDDELIVEGYPVFDPAKNVTAVLAQSVTTTRMQRTKREARKVET